MSTIRAASASPSGMIVLAFFIIYFVWGSTYLANQWAIADMPPFLMAGVRFFVAGVLLYGYCAALGKENPTGIQVRNSLKAGFFLFAMGNGLVVWALQYVDSGIAALVVAFEPLIVALMMWRMKAERPSLNTWAGILLGITGMLFLVGQPQYIADVSWLWGIVAIFCAIIAWGYISIWMVDANLPDSLLQRAALQMFFGGILLLLMGILMGELSQVNLAGIEARSFWSLMYLIIFGSIVAFTAFNFLLKNVSPTKIVTSTYINPVVALSLGYYLNQEQLNWQSLVAAGLLILGVVLITWKAKKKRTMLSTPLQKEKIEI